LTRDASKTREKLLETAIQLVSQSNYNSVGVNEICSQAGVTKGAFYHHFESKADLYLAASRHYWTELKKELDAIYSPCLTALENLENLIRFAVARHGQGDFRKVGAADTCDSSELPDCPFFSCGDQIGVGEEKVRQASAEMAENGLRYYIALVRNLTAEGMLEGDLDAVQTGRMLFQYMKGVLIYARIMNESAMVETDLRAGFYRLLDLKREHWRMPANDLHASAAN
jgi:TetR/AcrR family transcriptional regulator, transcriptional repressor for nem operon